jgi:hypothetical protein
MLINHNALHLDLYREPKERILDELVFYQQIFFPLSASLSPHISNSALSSPIFIFLECAFEPSYFIYRAF